MPAAESAVRMDSRQSTRKDSQASLCSTAGMLSSCISWASQLLQAAEELAQDTWELQQDQAGKGNSTGTASALDFVMPTCSPVT